MSEHGPEHHGGHESHQDKSKGKSGFNPDINILDAAADAMLQLPRMVESAADPKEITHKAVDISQIADAAAGFVKAAVEVIPESLGVKKGKGGGGHGGGGHH
ncbi:MAG TPA: hypothetical protein VHA30_04830 [Patescibacteria group bacterium]|nr:hypothetical protein [Patescibacteria group bacterium]